MTAFNPAALADAAELSVTASTPPLWRLLLAATKILLAVQQGQSTTTALQDIAAALRPGAQSLAFHVLRQLGRAQALRSLLAKRNPPPEADALLCCALALIWQKQHAPYDAFTLVNQTVEAAKAHPAIKASAGFINACLRRFLREQEALIAATDKDPVALWNHPRWWITRLKNDHPEHWQAIVTANNAQAPMTLRVNLHQTTVPNYLQALSEINLAAMPVGDTGLVLARAVPVHVLPGFDAGWVSVQDAAAQMAAPLLLPNKVSDIASTTPQKMVRILDACAAPGGKTAHLLELAASRGQRVHVTALDIDPERCERIHENLARLGLSEQALVKVADAADPSSWWDGQAFDAILLDAPCTASGIVRRHPDVRWLRRESDSAQLAKVQRGLLDALWPLLQPGGLLLYCTCSVFRVEGSAQIKLFLAHNTEATLQPSPGHLLPQSHAKANILPDNGTCEQDGFYYALLQKEMA